MAAASLGSATGSRVDSAAKHTMPCKIDTRFFKVGFEEQAHADNCLHVDKMKYAMQKDEIVMNTTKKFINFSTSQAYPLVVTSMGDYADGIVKQFLIRLYSQFSAMDFINLVKKNSPQRDDWLTQFCSTHQSTSEADRTRFKKKIDNLPAFRCQGVALGQAFASHLSGDTVATVLVGGMATVMNGHFDMFAGDEVQWYFDFENSQFSAVSNHEIDQGCRTINMDDAANDPDPDVHKSKKMKFMENRLMGSQSGIGNPKGMKSRENIFRIKSYKPAAVDVDDNCTVMLPHFGDKSRVFAKCIVGGRAGDMVDIMIMTQAS